MLDSELNSHETDNDEANGRVNSGQEPASVPTGQGVPAALFQAPQVLFQPPAPVAAAQGGRDTGARDSGARDSGARDTGARDGGDGTGGESDSEGGGRAGRRSSRDGGARDAGDSAGGESDSEGGGRAGRSRSRGGRGTRGARGGRSGDAAAATQADDLFSAESAEAADPETDAPVPAAGDEADEGPASRRRRRRTSRSRTRSEAAESADTDASSDEATDAGQATGAADGEDADAEGADAGLGDGASGRRRRRKRRRGSSDSDVSSPDDPPDTVVHVREPHSVSDDVRAIKGSTRLEAKKQRRREGRESGRRRPPVITESEFLARRESVERTMVVRQRGDRTQIAVLEDGVLVEHYVNRTTHQSYVGNVYLGKVQNVLPSMEAAFVDIGKGRNAVLYAGEVNFDASGLEGQPKRIESALKAGQSVIVQVTKDPVGHKGARLTSQISLPGRYLVYVPGASMTGISRKLPDTERNRLKHILKKVTPENAGVIVRTAAEGAAEAELDRDVTRLAAQWENIEKKAKTATAPALLYGEPDLTIRVVRDVFNEDFSKLIVSGEEGWDTIDEYVRYVAPHLADRLNRWVDGADGDEDVFGAYRIDEQLAKALERKVWLPSGGSLVIDRTEAMTVVDVNTGKFTGQGGNLEETVTRNNLEAAEEIVRQLRLRDVGGIVVIDFIDMVLESNRELVLRRMLECLARDRTKHQVAEVTSLGLVQMTRKRVGAGLLEAFSQPCECCNGRGVIITLDQPEPAHRSSAGHVRRPGSGNGTGTAHGAGNGVGGRSAQDRSWQDRPGSDRADRDADRADRPVPDRAKDRAQEAAEDRQEQDRPAKEEESPRGRRGRRDRRDGRTNGGTASASLVEVAEAARAATPVAVANDVPSVMTPADVDAAATESAAPVRRTRAGSAMARLAITPDESAPKATVAAAPALTRESEAALPAEASAAAVETPVAAEATSSIDVPAAEAAPPTEAALPADESAPVTEALPAAAALLTDESAPVIEALPAEEAAQPAEAAPAEEVAPATGETAPATQETAPVPEETAPVPEETAPVPEETAPVPEEIAPVPAALPAEGTAPAADAAGTPAEDVASVDAASAVDAGPVEDTTSHADAGQPAGTEQPADVAAPQEAPAPEQANAPEAAPETETAALADPDPNPHPAEGETFPPQKAPQAPAAADTLWPAPAPAHEAPQEAQPEAAATEPEAPSAPADGQPEG